MLRWSPDTRVLIGMIFTDLRHLCILLSKGRRLMITLGMDPHPGSHTVAALDLERLTVGQYQSAQHVSWS